MKLADKILNLRKQRGMSQEELAEKLNVSRQAVSRWEVGTAQPDASNILQLSRLFGVTADYLLNDDYESDHDVPAVKNTEAAASNKVKRILGLCMAAFGAFGNFIIYILSRFIEVMVPHAVYDNGEIWYYEFSSQHMGYSYRYFVKEHGLEFLTIFFWILFVSGLLIAFVRKEQVMELVERLKNKKN